MSFITKQHKVLAVSALCGVVGITVELQNSPENSEGTRANFQESVALVKMPHDLTERPKNYINNTLPTAVMANTTPANYGNHQTESLNIATEDTNSNVTQNIARNAGSLDTASSMNIEVTDQYIKKQTKDNT